MEKIIDAIKTVQENGRKQWDKETSQALEEIKMTTDTVKKASEGFIDQVKNYCSENPGKAIGIGLASGAVVGFSIAKLFGRRKSSTERVVTTIFETGHDLWERVKNNVEKPMKDLKDSIEARIK